MSSVNGVTTNTPNTHNTKNTQKAAQTQHTNNNSNANAAAQTETNEAATEVAEDEYAGSAPVVDTGNYNKSGKKDKVKVDYEKIKELKSDLKNNVGAFKKMAADMQRADGTKSAKSAFNNLKTDSDWTNWVQQVASGQLEVSAEDSAAAKDAISEDGYWGVEQTSDRLLEFAKAVSGGDTAQYDKLVEAIEKGFEGAKSAWGKDMPDITKQTYDRTMEKMKEWRDGVVA